MISIKRLVPARGLLGGSSHEMVFKLRAPIERSGESGYNVCIVKSDESGILFERVAPDGRRVYEGDTEVSAILVRPGKGLNEGEIVIDDGKRFVVSEDLREYDCDSDCVAVFLPKREPDAAVVAAGNKAYAEYKKRAYLDTIYVIGGVDVSLIATGHSSEAAAFAIGGAVGFGFLLQLIVQVDNIEKQSIQQLLGALRLSATAALIGCLDLAFSEQLHDQPSLMVWALLGFMSFRVALLL